MTKKEQVKQWVSKNPPKKNQIGYYKRVADRFETTSEYVRSIVKTMEVPNITENCQAKRTPSLMRKSIERVELAGKVYNASDLKNLLNLEKKKVNFGFSVPESLEEEVTHTIIEPGDFKVGIINDVHFPYHDKANTELALETMAIAGVDKIILNGDIVDFYGISRFSTKPDAPLIKEELDMAIDCIAQIRENFPKAEIYYKCGNHENRLYRYLTDRAAGLYGLEELSLPNLLKLSKYDVKFVDDMEFIIIGDLHIMHGHEMGVSTSGYNVAITMHRKFQGSMCFGHFHKTQDHYRSLPNGTVQQSHSIGALCNLSPQYRRYNDWNAGFAIIDFSKDGSYQFNNYRIDKGKLINVWPH